MSKKLPSIYSEKTDKKINNNEKVYYSNQEIQEKKEPIDIGKKINNIFNSPSYVYKIDVLIKRKGVEKNYKLIGKNQKNLITLDNELIPINEIENIEIKKEE